MLDRPQIMCDNEDDKEVSIVKKKMGLITGIIDLCIVASVVVLPIWSYASGGYSSIFSWDWGNMTTLELLDKRIYDKEILLVALLAAYVLLVLSAIFMFKKEKINLMKNLQAIASIVVVCMYVAVHIGIFSFMSDYSICELNPIGLGVVAVCAANVVLSFAFVKEKAIVEQPKSVENTIVE